MEVRPMSTVPTPDDFGAALIGEAIAAIYEFVGPDAAPADARHLLAHWRHAHRLTPRQLIAIVASFERVAVPPRPVPEHDGYTIGRRWPLNPR
jgi:hypothetical protein